MDLSTWLLFVLTEGALCFSPGPAVLYVVSQGMSHGFRASFAANLGIVAGSGIYFLASALGLGALILTSHQLFLAIKWIGVAYLVWLGIQMILASRGGANKAGDQSGGQGGGASRAARRPGKKAFKGALLIQLANPKNLVFFLAILPPFIDPSGNVALQVLILAVTSHALEVVALSIYGAAASKASGRLRNSPLSLWVERAAGTLLIGIGASLAFVKRVAP